MSEFDRHAVVSASMENEFANMHQFYMGLADCNLSIADISQGLLDMESASSTPTGLPSTPVFWGTDLSLNSEFQSPTTINGSENDLLDFQLNGYDECTGVWNSTNTVF